MAIVAESPMERLRDRFQIKNKLVVNLLSEFYGTMVLLFIGIGIVCQFILSHEKLNTWIQVNMGWGFAITFSVFIVSKTSGGHLNPAVSILMYSFGKLPLSWFFYYSIVQTLGAFCGSALAYLVYYDQVIHFTGTLKTVVGPNATAGLFCSMPPAHLSNTGAFIDQFVGTGFLALFVAVIIDKRIAIMDCLHPVLFGLVVAMIGMSFGMNVGYPINPARDLGPRIFAAMIGYGPEMFTYHNYYFWIPVVAPMFGVLVFGWSYQLLVGIHIPDPVQPRAQKLPDDAQSLPLKSDVD